jgi:pyridinium-3,5-biscarboxylic acid mononucleotide synthase
LFDPQGLPARRCITLATVNKLEEILSAVAKGEISTSEATAELKRGEVRYLDSFAALDPGRRSRKGVPEVVYAPGKTPKQTARICAAMLENSGERVIVSGASDEAEATLREVLGDGVPVRRLGRALVAGFGDPSPSGGRVAAMSAGTSDIPVLEEAIAVAREMGARIMSFHDVGVAGIHRLAAPLEEMRAFDPDCLIVAAGMEGALPTVVSALVGVPVIGLPTSTGYGLGGDGTAAILGMLQTCSPGLTVVNVDNGVGAGATAALIANRAVMRSSASRRPDREPDR